MGRGISGKQKRNFAGGKQLESMERVKRTLYKSAELRAIVFVYSSLFSGPGTDAMQVRTVTAISDQKITLMVHLEAAIVANKKWMSFRRRCY